jgi:hypothetical protein
MKTRGPAKHRGPTAIALNMLGLVERFHPGSKALCPESPLRLDVIVHEDHSIKYVVQ